MNISHLKAHRRKAGSAPPIGNPDRGGYTLIEVLLAISILSIGLLGIMALHLAAINNNSRAREIMSGSIFLADQIEKLISMDYAGQELAAGTTTAFTENGYRIERAVAATNIPNIKKIDIAVIRDAGGGRSFTATYYKGNRF